MNVLTALTVSSLPIRVDDEYFLKIVSFLLNQKYKHLKNAYFAKYLRSNYKNLDKS